MLKYERAAANGRDKKHHVYSCMVVVSFVVRDRFLKKRWERRVRPPNVSGSRRGPLLTYTPSPLGEGIWGGVVPSPALPEKIDFGS